MKKDIHPTYYEKATVTCACGNVFTMGSTIETLVVEVCSNCHPFYTGQDKIMDKVGRVQKFKERLEQKALRQAQGKQTKSNVIKAQATTVQKGRARVTTKVATKATKPASKTTKKPAAKTASVKDKKKK